ncbi:MAG: prepilin-type N-terminal cleavage/methylation domain-containing protein, partial [Clostridia bacterium]|nr:prepilin-type N-terminal cleavage/methylation domain-containing protein [Clostridia bacterium]
MKNIIKSYFSNKRGMTLVEVLTAMVLLSLIIFCFTPLFLTYFKAITIAGTEIQDVQEQSGILQTVIGNYSAGKGGNYSANVTEIGLELTTPQTATLTRENASGSTVSTNLNGAVTVALGTEIDDVKGDFLVSDPENLRNGYATIKAQGSSSGLVCYPKSLTDDFIEAKIIVYGSGGINFADSSFATDIKLYCGLNGGTSLSNGTDYTVRKLASSMLEFTIYGGGKVSYETSPLLINYKDGQHILQVEVDAPSMIMVGEADDEGKYYYYVSRGEVIDGTDADSKKDELAIIRRVMNTTSDPKDTNVSVSNPITLNSAMNDVEWVPADSADSYAVDSSGKKYGYYIMCGDNGQVRRFWRNNTTGNYYWGGDHTYYTDYNLDRFSGNSMYMNTTDKNGNASTSKVYSTDASFKYIALRPMQWESGSAPNDNFLGIGGSK